MKRIAACLLSLLALLSPAALASYPGDVTLTDPTKPYIVSSPGGFTIGDCFRAADVKGTAADAGTCGGLGAQNTIASASTTDIGSSGVTNNVKITGTTTITSLGSSAVTSSPLWFVQFSGALTLTYNGTSLQLPGAHNYTTHAGDMAICLYLGGGNWTCPIIQASNVLPAGGGFGAQTSIASASTTDLGTTATNNALVTGTTTITSFGSTCSTASPVYLIEFQGALTLTYNATSLILPGSQNITTAAHDFAIGNCLGSGNWRIWLYVRASNASGATLHSQTFVTSGTFTFPAGTTANTPFKFIPVGGGGGAGSNSGSSGGGAGGGGSGCSAGYLLSGFTAGQTATVTIGSGGTGSFYLANNGTAGGATTLVYNTHTVFNCAGGGGGVSGSCTNTCAGGAAGTLTTDFTGLTLIDAIATGTAAAGGTGAYAGGSEGLGGQGGSNLMGVGAPLNVCTAGGPSQTGANGVGYGAGGAGGCSSGGQSTGGNGSGGGLIIQWVL